ncbi:MAG: hypothetical protein OQJ84_02125 [Xanthomonadales bacterium]|nr:hypothetical protein [Xanthomonadales bacterium]
MFRFLRIAILLTILLVVAGRQFLAPERLNSWDKPLWVTIYPVLVEADPATRRYVKSLTPRAFDAINEFLKQQAARYGFSLEQPVVIQVADPLTTAPPPALPTENSGLGVALWSLKMRWWVWRHSRQDGLAPADAKMFVLYQQSKPGQLMERSVGVRNGAFGIVNAEASRQMTARNRVIITHELLHILGAVDRYDMASGQPLAPDGLANPQQSPLYPQQRAEIMAGRIATSAHGWRRPATLKSCVIGAATAAEIGWL